MAQLFYIRLVVIVLVANLYFIFQNIDSDRFEYFRNRIWDAIVAKSSLETNGFTYTVYNHVFPIEDGKRIDMRGSTI